MPLIHVHMLEGSTDEEKGKLVRALATATHDSIGSPWPTIRVWIDEIERAGWVIGTMVEEEAAQDGAASETAQ